MQDVRVFISIKEKSYYEYYKKHARINEVEFKYAYLVLGTQRLFKIMGVLKLAIKQGKIEYLKYLARTNKLIKHNLKNLYLKIKNVIKSK